MHHYRDKINYFYDVPMKKEKNVDTTIVVIVYLCALLVAANFCNRKFSFSIIALMPI